MKTPTKGLFGAVVLASLLLLAACATDPEPDNIQFGESVRHMIAIQTANPEADARGLDGEKAEIALRAYRADTGDRKDVKKENFDFEP